MQIVIHQVVVVIDISLEYTQISSSYIFPYLYCVKSKITISSNVCYKKIQSIDLINMCNKFEDDSYYYYTWLSTVACRG